MTDFQKMFRYDAWANRRLLLRLREVPDLDRHVRGLFAHIQVGLKVWSERIHGQGSGPFEAFPPLTLDECERLIDENEATYARLLGESSAGFPSGRDGGGEELLARRIAYTNQHGLSYETAAGDILLQVLFHGAYHRGQIAKLLRQSGKEPVNTDYITHVRELAGQPWKP